MKLLIIEDDPGIARALADFLKNDNYVVDTATDGEIGFNLAASAPYDLIITDYLLPRMDGRTIIRQLRQSGKNMPILVLSVRDGLTDKVTLLDDGADDYLTKPFSFKELQARIRKLLRRPETHLCPILTFADLTLDLASHEAIRGRRRIYLTVKEFFFLKMLLEQPRTNLSRAIITEEVWGGADNRLSNIVESLVLKLRRKIDFKKPTLIKTVPGRGYRLDTQN